MRLGCCVQEEASLALVWPFAVPATRIEFLCWAFDVWRAQVGDEWQACCLTGSPQAINVGLRTAMLVSWRTVWRALWVVRPYCLHIDNTQKICREQLCCTRQHSLYKNWKKRKKSCTVTVAAVSLHILGCGVQLESDYHLFLEGGAGKWHLGYLPKFNTNLKSLLCSFHMWQRWLHLSAPPPKPLLFALHAANQNPKVNYD